MGHSITIGDDRTFALAAELAAMTGESLEEAVSRAITLRIDLEQSRRAAIAKARNAVMDFHDLVENPRPSSDHGWLYDDETGLPIW